MSFKTLKSRQRESAKRSMTSINNFQLSILVGGKFKGENPISDESTFPCVNHFLEGNYERVLESSEVASKLLRIPPVDSNMCIGNYVKKNIEKLAQDVCECPENRNFEILLIGSSCLQLYVQNNWIGPQTEKDPLSFCHTDFKDKQKECISEALDELSIDGEETYTKSHHIVYLYLSRLILLEGKSFFSQLQTWDWWLMRCLMLQQSLLSERSPTLKTTVMEIIDDVSTREPLMTDDINRDVHIMFHLEAGHASHGYLEYKKAAEHFKTANKISGLDISLTGAMGKRTHFQVDDKPQLVLKVATEEGEGRVGCMFELPSEVPKVLPLGDDTVMENIKFTDDDVTATPDLSPVEHSLVLGLMESYRRSMAHERLTVEEVQTYLDYILHHSTNWCVTATALHLRSKLEKDSTRRVERSMMQLELLSKVTTSSTSPDSVGIRSPLFFASHLSPSWVIKRDYASILVSIGVFGEALDVFESLEMWEDVIACYQRLRKTEKAESLIRERLAIKETPTLWCYLGDVTNNIEDYLKAWELSNHRSSRAQRCMGYLHFNRKKFEQAIDCFSKSLEINPMQIPLWFTYGCGAMACEKYDLGAKAFRRCVTIDYDNYEAWSNLATCYVRLKEKKKAFSVLQDALKCSYDNWKLWENSLVIAIDVGEFNHVIRSYHRLMDLKGKWTDNEVLNILTRAVVEKIPDADGKPADLLHGKVMELFGRITSKVTGEGDVWSNYAKLSMVKAGDREPDTDKALQYLNKAYRSYSQKVDWEKDFESCNSVATHAINVAETHIQCSEGKTQQEAIRLLSSAKLMLRGALVKVQKQHTDPSTQVLASQVSEICFKMDSLLQDIISKIDALKQ